MATTEHARTARTRRTHRQELTAPQTAFLDSAAEHTLFCAGVGAGKTKAGAMWAAREALRWPGVGFVGANTYQQLNRVTLRALLQTLSEWGIPHLYGRRPPASWGASPFPSHENIVSVRALGQLRQIVAASLQNYDFLRGLSIRWFWIDETRDTAREAFDVLQARKRDGPPEAPRPDAVTTTPDGFNWLYDAFAADGPTALPSRRVIYADSGSNPWLPAGYVDGLLKTFSARLVAQEVKGQFVSLTTGQAFAEFSRDRHVRPLEYRPDLPIVHSLDFNVNPMASVVLQYIPPRKPAIWEAELMDRGDRVHVLDEIYLEGSARTRDATDEFIRRWGHHKQQVCVYGDRSARSRDTRSEQTDFQIIETEYKRAFGARTVMKMNTRNPSVAASVADVNCLLLNARGQSRLFIDPRCTRLVRDLEAVSFKPGTRDLDKSDPELTHVSDALRYYVSAEFPALSLTAGAFVPRGM